MSTLVRNEQTKLLAGAINNLGVAAFATGGIVPTAVHFSGLLQVDDPLRLLALSVVWSFAGGPLVATARLVLKGLV